MNKLLIAIAALAVWAVWAFAHATEPPAVGVEVARGVVTVNDPGDCEFAVGQTAMLMVHPKGEDCVRLRVDFLGKRIRLVAVLAP